MNETTQAIVEIKREVQLSVLRRQIQAREEQGATMDEWCISRESAKVLIIID